MNILNDRMNPYKIYIQEYRFLFLFIVIVILGGLYISSFVHYLLFHTLVEFFTIAIAFCIFFIAWNVRAYLTSNFLKLLGFGYTFIALIDLVHTLAYKGMDIFPGYGANLPTQLWITARYLQAVTIATASFFITRRRLNDYFIIWYFAITVSILIAMVFLGKFPDCYIDGEGLTVFKIISEYVITIILFVSLVSLYKKRDQFNGRILSLIIFSIVCTIFSEISFTAYVSVYGFANLVGHLFKLAAFYLLYRAIIVTGLQEPFALIFREMNDAKDKLQKNNIELEQRITERTAQLQRLNRELRAISNCNQTLLRAVDEQSLIQDICRIICDEAGYIMSWVGYAENNVNKTIRPVAWAGKDDGYLTSANITWDNTEHEYGPAGMAIRSGESVCIQDFMIDTDTSTWRKKALERGYHSSISLPLNDQCGVPFGALIIYSTEPDAFTAEERMLLTELADDLAFGINVLRVNNELKQTENSLRVNNERYRMAQVISRSGNWEYNLQTTNFWGSDEAKRIYGFDPEQDEFTTDEVENCIPDREWVHQALVDLIEKGKPYDLEFKIHPKNSSEPKFITSKAELQRDQYGNSQKVVGVIQDVTERRKALNKLNESEKQYRIVFENSPVSIWEEDFSEVKNFFNKLKRNGVADIEIYFDQHPETVRQCADMVKFVDANRAALELHAGAGNKELSSNLITMFTPETLDMFRKVLACLWNKGKEITGDTVGRTLAGDRRNVAIYLTVCPGYEETLSKVLVSLVDITEHKRAEQERLVHLRFLEGMDKINLAIQRAKDLEQMMGDVLEAVLTIFDCDRAYLMYPCDPDAEFWTIPMERFKAEYPGFPSGSEIPMTSAEAETIRILLNADGPVKSGPEKIYSIPGEISEHFDIKSFMSIALYPKIGKPWRFGLHQCAYIREWTSDEEKLFQEVGRRLSDALTGLIMYRDLQESKNRYKYITEGLTDYKYSVRIQNGQAVETVHDPSCAAITGYSAEEFAADPYLWFNMILENDREIVKERVQHILAGENIQPIELRIRHKDGEIRWISDTAILFRDAYGKLASYDGVIKDVTERKLLEEQFLQAQKMESIGRLAGGVAHDFNNMLNVIIGNTDLALIDIDESSQLFNILKEIRNAAQNSSNMTQQLLAFARKQTIAAEVLNLNDTIEEMLKILRRMIGENIEIAWLPGPDIWPVMMDISQINQILANLCVNARDAVGETGKITIATSNIVFDEVFCSEQPEFSPGEFVVVRVSDNGCGIDEETLQKIFDPFYTTKEMGKGTGLGLATVYGIVDQNHGFIKVFSEPGQGTSFNVYIPRYLAKKKKTKGTDSVNKIIGGYETILLVEDEASVLKTTRSILERLGYRVLSSVIPSEAIEIAKNPSSKIDLLMTDLIMPKMDGMELAKKIISLKPGLKCLFMSGYIDNVKDNSGILDIRKNFIQKPFSRQSLAVKVRNVIDN